MGPIIFDGQLNGTHYSPKTAWSIHPSQLPATEDR
jgi:hypothetical protein